MDEEALQRELSPRPRPEARAKRASKDEGEGLTAFTRFPQSHWPARLQTSPSSL